jgi:hypothetical protein
MEVVQIKKELKIEDADQIKKQSFIYNYDENHIMHIFKDTDSNVLKNKRNKIEAFKEIENMFNIKITSVVEKNGLTRGYILEKDENYIPLAGYMKYNKKKKVNILKNLNEYLKLLHKNNVYYGDITFQNLENLKNTDKIRINNIDDISINGYEFDEITPDMHRYISQFGIDEKLDTYIFNIFTVSYITGVPTEILFFYLRNNRLPFLFDSKENRNILDSMSNFDNNKDIEPIIEHIKRYHF